MKYGIASQSFEKLAIISQLSAFVYSKRRARAASLRAALCEATSGVSGLKSSDSQNGGKATGLKKNCGPWPAKLRAQPGADRARQPEPRTGDGGPGWRRVPGAGPEGPKKANDRARAEQRRARAFWISHIKWGGAISGRCKVAVILS